MASVFSGHGVVGTTKDLGSLIRLAPCCVIRTRLGDLLRASEVRGFVLSSGFKVRLAALPQAMTWARVISSGACLIACKMQLERAPIIGLFSGRNQFAHAECLAQSLGGNFFTHEMEAGVLILSRVYVLRAPGTSQRARHPA